MSGDSLRESLDFAVELARLAGEATLARFQTGIAVETKADRTPVTEADRAAERLLRERIEARYPEDGIVGEEYGTANASAPRLWIVDPIDGTKAYAHGVPIYGVLVALAMEGKPCLGVIHLPALRETVWAADGLGCWWNGRPARVSEVDRVEDAVVLTTDAEHIAPAGRAAGWDRLRRRARFARTWGDCYGYALVATGRAEAMLDPVMSPWDVAALGPVIREAGGVLTDWDGNDSALPASAVATNAALAADVRRLLQEAG